MYLTTKKLITYLTKNTSPDILIETIKVITKLLSKYGKTVFQPSFIAKIETVDPVIASCLVLLKKTGRVKIQQVQNILYSLEKQGIATPTYTIDTQREDISIIEEILTDKKTNPINIIHNKKKKEVGLRIAGGGKYYERNVDQDLQKLLKIPKR